MKLIIIHQYDPTVHHVGGIGTFTDALIRNAPDDIEVQLLCVTAQPKRFPVGRWHSFSVGNKELKIFPLVATDPLKVTFIPLALKMAYALFRYRKKIPTQDAVICFHRIEPMLGFLKDSVPKALFLHGHNMKDFYNKQTEIRWGKFPWLYFWLEEKLLPQADHIYIVREDAIEDYQKKYPAKANDISFVPTWADESVFCSMDKEERKASREKLMTGLGLSPSTPFFLYVGRYVGQKDPLRLLRSFKLVLSRYPDANLILIGEGNLKGDMQSYIQQENLSASVHFLAPMTQKEIGQWMNSADTLCLSSAFEGMPCVIVEALHCGLPVVSTAVGEAGRLIGESQEGGRLVAGKGPEPFSEAMMDCLENPPSAEACRNQVTAFTARKILEPVYKKYHAMLEN